MRLIRSVRKILHGILKQQRVDKDVLQTVLAEMENILNSRLLTDLSTEAYDEEPLIPNHLLLLRKGAGAPVKLNITVNEDGFKPSSYPHSFGPVGRRNTFLCFKRDTNG